MSQLCASDDQNTGTSASASVLPVSIQGWPVWSPCCPRDFQKSSPVPQFESVNSLALWLLYGPALTTVCEHWEDHSLDYMDFCQQSSVSAFQLCLGCHSFPAKKQLSSDFMAAVTGHCDFRAQEEEICLWFHLFPFFFPRSNGARCHDLSFFNV